MDSQTIINVLLGVVVTLLGTVLKMFWHTQKDLQAEIKRSTEDLSRVKVLVAGEYATRTDVDRKFDAMLEKLDRIERKLDRKVDK